MTNTTDDTNTGLILPAKWYNRAKWFLFVFLPAFSAAYSSAALLFDFGFVAQVVGGASILGLFLGTVLGVSNKNYNKLDHDGSLNAKIEGETVLLSDLKLPNIAAEELPYLKSVTVQINPHN